MSFQDILSDQFGVEQDIDNEEEGEQFGKPERSIKDTIQALQVIIEFVEDAKTTQLRAIERLEQDLEVLEVNSRSQRTLDGWIR
jgi:hypothetical protein